MIVIRLARGSKKSKPFIVLWLLTDVFQETDASSSA